MNHSLTISLDLSADDYIRVLRRRHLESFFVKYGAPLTFVTLFLGILGFILFLSLDAQQVNVFSAVLVAFLPSAVGAGAVYATDRFISIPLLSRSVRKQIASNPTVYETATVTFDNEGITTVTSLTSGSVKWDGFIRAVENETDFLFYTTSKFSHFVPKETFLSETDIDFVRCLARAKLAEKAEF